MLIRHLLAVFIQKQHLIYAAQYGHTEVVEQLIAHGADEASLTLEQQTQVEQAIAEARAILIARNNRNSACALADIGQELQRVSIIQKPPM